MNKIFPYLLTDDLEASTRHSLKKGEPPTAITIYLPEPQANYQNILER